MPHGGADAKVLRCREEVDARPLLRHEELIRWNSRQRGLVRLAARSSDSARPSRAMMAIDGRPGIAWCAPAGTSEGWLEIRLLSMPNSHNNDQDDACQLQGITFLPVAEGETSVRLGICDGAASTWEAHLPAARGDLRASVILLGRDWERNNWFYSQLVPPWSDRPSSKIRTPLIDLAPIRVITAPASHPAIVQLGKAWLMRRATMRNRLPCIRLHLRSSAGDAAPACLAEVSPVLQCPALTAGSL
jgi:hypothetical protein